MPRVRRGIVHLEGKESLYTTKSSQKTLDFVQWESFRSFGSYKKRNPLENQGFRSGGSLDSDSTSGTETYRHCQRIASSYPEV